VSRVPALVVMHADLGEALLRAARQVYGDFEDVEALSNSAYSRDDLERAIEERVARWPHGGLVLCDFPGGSCQQCSLLAARIRSHGPDAEIVLVTGANLSALLDYLHNRDQYGVVELAERIRKRAQDSIRVQRGQQPA